MRHTLSARTEHGLEPPVRLTLTFKKHPLNKEIAMMTLKGYPRKDGRIGFRNWVLVLPLTGCQLTNAWRIADQTPGATCFSHPNGCDLHGPDFELFGSILERFVTHPNVGGVTLLAMGCAQSLKLNLPRKIKESGRLVEVVGAHENTSAVVARGIEKTQAMVAELARTPRIEVDASALVVGTKCGASDANSFEHCHPVVGRACDILVADGATVVLSEDCELIGGARRLAERASTPEIGGKILAMADTVNRQWKERFGKSREESLEQSAEEAEFASLRHVAKAGTGPISGFFDMSETVAGPGLVILDAPNTDLENVTALAAAGCNVNLFTTGRGTPVGSPTAVTVKITATESTFEKMREDIDICVSDVIYGTKVDEEAERLVDLVVASANGKLTKAEETRHWEVAIPIRGVTF